MGATFSGRRYALHAQMPVSGGSDDAFFRESAPPIAPPTIAIAAAIIRPFAKVDAEAQKFVTDWNNVGRAGRIATPSLSAEKFVVGTAL